jgi:hypothetical protein
MINEGRRQIQDFKRNNVSFEVQSFHIWTDGTWRRRGNDNAFVNDRIQVFMTVASLTVIGLDA